MNEKPLLIFRSPQTVVGRLERPGFSRTPPAIHYPAHEAQVNRLTPIFRELQSTVFSLQESARDQDIYSVLILEPIGRVEDFMTAVRNIGFEGIGEFDISDLEPDEDFHMVDDETAMLGGQLYLVMTNFEALRQLLRLWELHSKNPDTPFALGLTRWKTMFMQLKSIRFWGSRERFIETGLFEFWRGLLTSTGGSPPTYRMEAELWYKDDPTKRAQQQAAFLKLVEAEEGRLIGPPCIIPEIRYHGLLVELPAVSAQKVIAFPDKSALNSGLVMHFRPVGQSVNRVNIGEAGNPVLFTDKPLPTGTPIVALLDGFPMQNHKSLDQRLYVDDPDGWEGIYDVEHRAHGTAMASLIIHNDLDANQSAISSPLYVRPILQPRETFGGSEECIPENILFIDLLHRAIKRLFEPDGDLQPVAPTIRVVNLSVCDPLRPFLQRLSPLAKLVDWLSYKYNVLFVISAGNYPEDLLVELRQRDVYSIPPEELQDIVLETVIAERRNRTLFSPAEAINALTIGASHSDASRPVGKPYQLVHLYKCDALPSPLSAIGHGYRRSIKPDLLMPGGRPLYKENIGSAGRLSLLRTHRPPGNRVATPSPQAGDLEHTYWTRGTSNSAAIATHSLVKLDETLTQLHSESASPLLDQENRPALLKALLVHGAHWGEAENILQNNMGGTKRQKQRRVTQLIGYGLVSVARLHECTDLRATMLASNRISKDTSHFYHFPLPSSLMNVAGQRVFTVTLAWFTPVSCTNKKYRKAQLEFEFTNNRLVQLGQRLFHPDIITGGTVQHEVLTNARAWQFEGDSSIEIVVRCTEDALGLGGVPISYGLVATLEVAPSLGIQIYDPIREMITPRVRIVSS